MSEIALNGGTVTMETLGSLIDLLRERGVLHAQVGDLSVTLDPNWKPPVKFEPDEEPRLAVDKPAKLGSDGLTAAQQLEWHGRVIDAED
jgi:hypothetical protein